MKYCLVLIRKVNLTVNNMDKEQKASHGIKISQQNVDIKDADLKDIQKPASKTRKQFLPHLLYAMALPYFFGARTQVERYKTASSTLKQQPVKSVQTCLHEVSCLFEDLATVSKYAEMCGQTHELHSLWLDVRNHIRHDVREEFDNELDKRKNERAKRLGLNEKLQTSIGFVPETITVGGTQIAITTINDYLSWAENVIGGVLKEAEEKGWIK